VKTLDDLMKKLPAPAARAVCHGGSLVVGLVLAVLVHYVLYRLGLPSKPFIYVAF
jgi:hypothetical protein